MDEFSQDFTNYDQSFELKADPSKYPFLSGINISSDVKRRLSLHLDSIFRGTSENYLTPLGKSISSESGLKAIDSMIERSKSINDVLLKLELSNRDKFGSRSIAAPWKDRKPALLDYFKDKGASDTALSQLQVSGSIRNSLRPLTLDKASTKLKSNTNSGLPYYTKKGLVKTKNLDNFDSIIREDYPCILFTRTQEGSKTRNVWGYPMADSLIEAAYYFPLLEYQRKQPWRAALRGPDDVDAIMRSTMINANLMGNSVISIDFSSFDSSVSTQIQKLAFDYIKDLFQTKERNVIDRLFTRFNTIGIVTPSGIYAGPHGIPSGSTFTNEVGSISQRIVAMSNPSLSVVNQQQQGDDGIYELPSSNVDSLFETFKSAGLNVNLDKSYVSRDYSIFLQRLYHIDYIKQGIGGGIYSIYRAFNRLYHQERYANFEDFGLSGRDYYSIRAISILENCKYHPLFKEFVQYILKVDKYSLEYSQNGLKQYINMFYEGSGTGGVINNQLGDNIKGLNSFETVKIIRDSA